MTVLSNITLLWVMALIFGSAAAPKVPAHLVGVWAGNCEVYGSFNRGQHGDDHPENRISIEIRINSDRTVEGTVGNAVLRDCRFKRNRGTIGRWLNFKTDFIVKSGYLDGRIVPADNETRREFTIPFNIVDGQLRGSVMTLKPWTYPFPVVPRLLLEKQGDLSFSQVPAGANL